MVVWIRLVAMEFCGEKIKVKLVESADRLDVGCEKKKFH